MDDDIQNIHRSIAQKLKDGDAEPPANIISSYRDFQLPEPLIKFSTNTNNANKSPQKISSRSIGIAADNRRSEIPQ